jgi:hypothetical protein
VAPAAIWSSATSLVRLPLSMVRSPPIVSWAPDETWMLRDLFVLVPAEVKVTPPDTFSAPPVISRLVLSVFAIVTVVAAAAALTVTSCPL